MKRHPRHPGDNLGALVLLLGLALTGCGGRVAEPGIDPTARLEADGPSDTTVAPLATPPDVAPPPAVAAVDSLSPGALLGASRVLWWAGRHEAAIARLEPHRATWEAALRGESSEASREDARELLARLALHQAAAGRLEEAGAERAVLAADTTHSALAASRLAYLELRGEEFARAAAPAARAFRADSTRAVRLNNFGITRLQAGDVDEAERLLRSAIAREPGLPGPYYNLAILTAFYRMDPVAGRRWFAEYRRRATEDPDHLSEALADPAARADRDGGEQ